MSTIRSYQLTDEQVGKILDFCDSMIEECGEPEERKVYEDLESALLIHFGHIDNEEDFSIDSEYDSEI